MHQVVATLKPGSRGKEVKILNKFLVRLLEEGAELLDTEQSTIALSGNQLKEVVNQSIEYYGPITELLIRWFQKKQRLPETGELTEETASTLNAVGSRVRAFEKIEYEAIDRALHTFWRDRFPQPDIRDFNVRVAPAQRLSRETLGQPGEISVIHKPFEEDDEEDDEATSPRLLRLSVRGGEYTYAKPNDIVMIESSDHFTVVHVAQQGKVKTSLRNCCLKKVLLDLPKNSFLRVNRFCAINLNRISGGSYHQQYFEFDHCIKVKPRHPLSHAIFQSIGE